MGGINHYLKYERTYIVLMLFAFLLIENSINATTIIMEWVENGVTTPAWVAFALEYTSGIAIAMLFPLVLWFEKRFPLDWQVFKHNILWHIPASLVFSLFHIALMAAMRAPLFRMNGITYGLDEFSWELLFEYRQDAWTYIFILLIINIYRFILSRLRGEASLVDSGENEGAEIADRLLIRKLGKEFIIRVDDIEWMEASGNYVNLYIRNHIYPLRSTLSSLVAKLEMRGFRRVHRSFAVNLDCVASITPLDSGDASITLANGREIPLSRRYREEFRQQL
ncbi:MAG: LytTR family transcriptional regulator [Xanthomonadales bacterium]|nr:LytTR family transcriptional regulator [Xanthomonadales bacterium]